MFDVNTFSHNDLHGVCWISLLFNISYVIVKGIKIFALIGHHLLLGYQSFVSRCISPDETLRAFHCIQDLLKASWLFSAIQCRQQHQRLLKVGVGAWCPTHYLTSLKPFTEVGKLGVYSMEMTICAQLSFLGFMFKFRLKFVHKQPGDFPQNVQFQDCCALHILQQLQHVSSRVLADSLALMLWKDKNTLGTCGYTIINHMSSKYLMQPVCIHNFVLAYFYCKFAFLCFAPNSVSFVSNNVNYMDSYF